MITIIDYGIGNLRSIEKAFQAVGADVLRTDRIKDLERADRLVLPGVGAFGACADEIRRRDLEQPILDAVHRDIPFLGVCVGMQLLFEYSEEMGHHKGLGILPGRVKRFSDYYDNASPLSGQVNQGTTRAKQKNTTSLKIPHMGWNTIDIRHPSPLLTGIESGSFFYFVHSYHVQPIRQDHILASTPYGTVFPSIVSKTNVFGVQFHPEKSQKKGLRLLKNFTEMESSAR